MLGRGGCLVHILMNTAEKVIFVLFFATYLTISIIALLGKAVVSTSFDRISNTKIPRCCGSGVGRWLQLQLDP